MIGIATFRNFGLLQALLNVIGFALLDDHVPEEGSTTMSVAESEHFQNPDHAISSASKIQQNFASSIGVVSACLAAIIWTLYKVGTCCLDTWAIKPLVYGLVAVGSAIACLPILQYTSKDFMTALISLAILFRSTHTMANGLGMHLPARIVFEA
jgi:hypothetical protein